MVNLTSWAAAAPPGAATEFGGYRHSNTRPMGFLSRALWLVVVYWVTIGLVVMILGAHQFHLKVAANAAVNPATSLTIGELIRQRNIYRELQDAADSLQAEAKTKASEVAKFQREAILAIGEQEKLGAAVAIAVQQLAASVVIPRSTQGEKGDAPTLVPDNLGRRDLAQWARGHIRTDVSRKLNETLVKEETKFAEAEAIRFIAQKQADVATARLAVLRLELIPQAEKNLKNFLEGLTARPAPPAGAPPPTNGGSVLGLLYELDSFTNLSFLWFGLVEPMKFVTLPGSVLTLLLALSMGALGSTLFVTGEFFGVGASRPFAWFLFRPFLGMITALAVFVVFKAGQLTMAGGAPSSNSEIDLNPFLVSFFAVIAGLLSEHAIARLSMVGKDWLDRIGKEKAEAEEAEAAKKAAEQAPPKPPSPEKPLTAKNWSALFGQADGKSLDGLVAALRADPARVEAWIAGTEPVPAETVNDVIKYFGKTRDELFSEGT